MYIDKADKRDIGNLRQMYFQLMGIMPDTTAMEDVMDKIFNTENYYLLVARNDTGKAVGTAMGIICYDLTCDCQPFMVIENVVVDESYRGKGAGRALLSQLQAVAVSNKCAYIMLVSGVEKASAHIFYEKVGFKQEKGFKKMLI